MKLYYSAGACSLSPHIVLCESGLDYELASAPTKTHKLADGTDYYAINPLGYVPLLELDDGRRLREGPAIVQYIADQVPDRQLAPAWGSFERYRLLEWLTFIGTELHRSFSPLFDPATPAETRASFTERIKRRLTWVDGELAGKQYLMGEQFTVADAYLFTVSNWSQFVGIDLAPYERLQEWRGRVGARPAVVRAMKEEGLIK